MLVSPPSPLASVQQLGAGGRSLNTDSVFPWQLTDLGYKQLGKALVRSLKQREQEDLACGDSAAHPSSFTQQSQTPFALFQGNDSNRAAKARLPLCFNLLGVEQCGFVSKVATGEDFSGNDLFFCSVESAESFCHHSFQSLPRCWLLF